MLSDQGKKVQKISKSTLLLGAGLGLGIGSTVLWLCLESFIPHSEQSSLLLPYFFMISTLLFGLTGFLLGKNLDTLYSILDRDNLTVLLNQRAFLRDAGLFYALGSRHGEVMALIMLDIDHFKSVNDTHNHLMGSFVLKKVGQLIHDNLRSTDLAARYGGDEYVIAIFRTQEIFAEKIAERIRKIIENTTFHYRGCEVKVTISLGIAVTNCKSASSVDDLIASADAALYQAKNAGRNKSMVISHISYENLNLSA